MLVSISRNKLTPLMQVASSRWMEIEFLFEEKKSEEVREGR